MFLKNSYWYFQSVIPKKICNKIINHANKLKDTMQTGSTFDSVNNNQDIKDLKKRRNSDIIWLNDEWIYKEIHPYIHRANINAGWNFDWDWSEPCQYTQYKKGQFYDWHCDSLFEPYSELTEPNFFGKIRKLSVTVSLSDPKDYKGGELEFDFRSSKPSKKEFKLCTEILPIGSLVVFPSFVWHRVRKVKSGVRKSLVIWSLGKPFK